MLEEKRETTPVSGVLELVHTGSLEPTVKF